MGFFYNYQTRLWAKKELMSRGKSEEEALRIIRDLDDDAKVHLERAIEELGAE